MKRDAKPRSLPQLASAYSWLFRFLVFTTGFAVAGVFFRAQVGRIFFIAAGVLAVVLVLPSMIRLKRIIVRVQRAADAFMKTVSQARVRAELSEVRAQNAENRYDRLVVERVKLRARVRAIRESDSTDVD